MCKKLTGVKDADFKYWKTETPYLLINAVFEFESGEMSAAFRKVRMVLGDVFYGDDYESKRDFIHAIEHDIEWNARIFRFLKQIPPFSLSFKEWSEQTENLLQTYWELEDKPTFVPFQKKDGYKMKEMANVPVEQYHQSKDTKSEYHKSVDTIHAVKGATFDAVLLFLSSASQGQSISFNDFPQEEVVTMSEKQRLIYVACSRAAQFLAFAVPSTVSDDVITTTLEGIDVDIRIINLQGELALV